MLYALRIACIGMCGACLGGVLAFLFLRRVETVSDITHGADHMLIFSAQLGAEPTDMHVDGTSATVIIVAPYFLQQLRAGEYASRMLHKILEQLEFLVGKVDRMAAQACRIAIGVHDQIAGTDETVLVLYAGFGGSGCGSRRSVATFRHQTQAPLDLAGEAVETTTSAMPHWELTTVKPPSVRISTIGVDSPEA